MTYVQVQPREHDPQCRRGTDAVKYTHLHALDLEQCERCGALDARLREVQARARFEPGGGEAA